MASKESSFDVVSQVDMQEVDNAFQQSRKELSQRYDLKDSGSKITLDKQKGEICITAPSDFVAKQVIDIMNSKFVKRKIDLASVKWSSPESASSGNVKVIGNIVWGIDKELASKINKDIKSLKLKVKTQIEGDKIRVSSASKDTLQDVISHLRSVEYGIPLQFVNYR